MNLVKLNSHAEIGIIFWLFYSMFKILSLFTCFCTAADAKPVCSNARLSTDENDYYETFEEQLTTRLYIGKKYTSLVMQGPGRHSIAAIPA